jgi:hypothetical protein
MEQGLLDLSVELSARSITAGTEFALYVIVTNPFGSSVWVREVNVTLPTDLRLFEDKELKQRAERNEELEGQKRQEEAEQVEAQHKELSAVFRSLVDELRTLNRHTENGSDSATNDKVALVLEDVREAADKLNKTAYGSAEIVAEGASIEYIRVGAKATRVVLGPKTQIRHLDLLEPWQVDAQRTKVRTVSLKSSLPDHAALKPGSTAVYTATLVVKRSIMFTPATYRLVFFVNYTFEQPKSEREAETLPTDSLRTNRIAYELAIRAPIHAVILGSVAGGVIGSIGRLLQLHTSASVLDWLLSASAAMVLSGMAVVFLARKSDAQSFVSVEDFWGGMLMGFLIGYTGTSFFGTLTGFNAPAPLK